MPQNSLDVQPQLKYTLVNRRSRRLVGHPRAGGLFFFIPISALLFLCSACTTSLSTLTTPENSLSKMGSVTLTLKPSLTPSPTVTPMPPTTPSHPPSPTEAACLEQPGSLIFRDFDHPSIPQGLPYRIYLPPCYVENLDTRYPTLYLLHGLQTDDRQWDELGADEIADALIIDGTVSPFIIVMPWHKSGIDIEAVLVEAFIPHIDQVFRTIPQAESRAIGGLSRGGGWALRIGLRHPDLFNAIGLHSPAIFYSNPYIAAWVKEIPKGAIPRVWIDVGDKDPLHKETMELISFLTEQGISLTTLTAKGDHSAEYWSSHLKDYLTWYTFEW